MKVSGKGTKEMEKDQVMLEAHETFQREKIKRKEERRGGHGVGEAAGKKSVDGLFFSFPPRLPPIPLSSLVATGIHLGFKDDPQTGRSGVPRVIQPVLTCLLGCCHASFIGGL